MKLFILLALATAGANAASIDSIGRPSFPEGRIINGQNADKGEAPFIVSFKDDSHFCAGSIIDKHWVLTAAHCLELSSFTIVAGLHIRNDESDVQIRKIPNKSVQYVHKDYMGGVGPTDIGLIYIAEPFDLNGLARNSSASVAKIDLPSGLYEQTGDGRLFGWGRTNSGGLPKILQTLDVKIIGYTQCKAALPSYAPIAPVNICSYTAGAADGACNGDSGGPLVRYTPAGAELVGIVSWGYTPCATTTYPSVFTMTSAYTDWIDKIIYNSNVMK